MSELRIVHTCLRYPPASGGAETYVREIVEGTRAHDQELDVRVLTSSLKTHGPISTLDPMLLRQDAVYVQRLHHASTPFLSYPRLQALSYYIGHHKPDIIESYGFWYQPADVSARYAKKHHIPFIFHPIFYSNEIRQKPAWKLYAHTIGKATFAAADVVVVISPHEQELITNARFPVKRFELIPPGIDMARFEKQFPNPYQEKGIHGPVLLTVARLAGGKGLEDIIEIFPAIQKAVSDVQAVIIGEDFGMASVLQEKIKSHGLENKIHLWGKVSEAELVAAYQHATLLFHPSHYEAFGITLAESLAAGVPVVVRNVGAVAYVVQPEKSGFLYTSQEEAISSVITLLTNNNVREKFGAYGKAYVQDMFAWEKGIKKLTSLYRELRQN